jgi:hypothetical protein
LLAAFTAAFTWDRLHYIHVEQIIRFGFDVVNLFTTTPTEAALNVLREKFEDDNNLKSRTHRPVSTLLEFVSTCVKNTHFQFGQNFYKQQHGMAMGSPLSPVLCNLYVEDLELKALSSFTPKPSLFMRYVDDIFIVWPEDINPLEVLYWHILIHFRQLQNLQ